MIEIKAVWLKNIKRLFRSNVVQRQTDIIPETVRVIARADHNISRAHISKNAIKVLYRLKNAGFDAYLVGGGVRDLLLGREPKDFDVVTNARPEQIRKCFRNGRLIGKRFRLVHILFQNEIIEVSTFRAHGGPDISDERQTEEGMLLSDNRYGTISEDAARRDFSINALYYNIADFSLIDFHNGLHDLKQGIIRVIGEPRSRFREDPVRMLRALRFAAKLGFKIENESEQTIFELGHLLSNVSPARLLTEIEKLFLTGMAVTTFKLLRHCGLFKYLFPLTATFLSHDNYETVDRFITHACQDTDDRVMQGKPVTPSYLMAVMLWFPIKAQAQNIERGGVHLNEAMHIAVNDIIHEQTRHTAMPRRYIMGLREICLLQLRFKQCQRNKILRTLAQPRFRAAFDFLHLRSEANESKGITELYQWWHQYYHGDIEQKTQLLKQLQKQRHRKIKQQRGAKES